MEISDRRENQIVDSFIADDLKMMEMASNYNQWLMSLIEPHIGQRVLEIGPGIGTFSKRIIQLVDLLVGVEPNQFCAAHLNQSLGDYPNFQLLPTNLEECDYHSLSTYNFDTILCMNVLEHIKDDIATLHLFEKILKPNGRVVLLVPAIPQAYGPIDKAVGHFRRYTKTSMRLVVGKTSMTIERLFYSNFIGLMGWMYNAKIKKLVGQNERQIYIFNKLVPLISAIEKKVGCLVGQSLICVARIPKQ